MIPVFILAVLNGFLFGCGITMFMLGRFVIDPLKKNLQKAVDLNEMGLKPMKEMVEMLNKMIPLNGNIVSPIQIVRPPDGKEA